AGRPAQMQSGAVFEFSPEGVRVHAPQPMSGAQISPVLSARCPLAIMKGDSDSASICRKEAKAVDMNRAHTSMESLSAHDEFGVAFIQFEHDVRRAFAEFSRAIDLAPGGLNESDAEWAELHWHRAVAAQQLQRNTEAYRDLSIAERSFVIAAKDTPVYRDF